MNKIQAFIFSAKDHANYGDEYAISICHYTLSSRWE